MGRLALVRHGETAWNAEGRLQGQTDIALNEIGRAQASAAGLTLRGLGEWDVLVSSPLGRAAETARIIGERLGLNVDAPVTDLQERHYGEGEGRAVDGLPREEVRRLIETAEPEAEVVDRALAALAGIVERHAGKDIVVVTHGTLLRLILGAVHGAPFRHVENAEVLVLDAGQLVATAERVVGANATS